MHIDRPASEVYAYASDPARASEWAAGMDSTAEVTRTPQNEYGILDHDVHLPSGETVHVPMRVTVDGAGSEVIFTIRPQPGMTEQDMERDADAVRADLATLKKIMEGA